MTWVGYNSSNIQTAYRACNRIVNAEFAYKTIILRVKTRKVEQIRNISLLFVIAVLVLQVLSNIYVLNVKKQILLMDSAVVSETRTRYLHNMIFGGKDLGKLLFGLQKRILY